MIIKGHQSSVRHALYSVNDKLVISASDDKTVRIWDVATGSEVKCLEFQDIPSSIELSPDGTLLSVCAGRKVSFWSMDKLERLKEFQSPTTVLSATLHPDKTVFVCGGDDFKMYKYNYQDGSEIGLC